MKEMHTNTEREPDAEKTADSLRNGIPFSREITDEICAKHNFKLDDIINDLEKMGPTYCFAEHERIQMSAQDCRMRINNLLCFHAKENPSSTEKPATFAGAGAVHRLRTYAGILNEIGDNAVKDWQSRLGHQINDEPFDFWPLYYGIDTATESRSKGDEDAREYYTGSRSVGQSLNHNKLPIIDARQAVREIQEKEWIKIEPVHKKILAKFKSLAKE